MTKYEGRCERCGAQLTVWTKNIDSLIHDDADPFGEYCGGTVAPTQVTPVPNATNT